MKKPDIKLSDFKTEGREKVKRNVAEFIGSIQDGGAETLVKDYALMLDRELFNVSIIVLRRMRNTANDKILSRANVEIIEIYKRSDFIFKAIQRLNCWWYVPLRLNLILKEKNIEVLHIHMKLLQYVSKIRKKINNVKLFYTCHSEPKYFIGKKVSKEYASAKRLIADNNLQMIALHDDMRKEINEMLDIDNTVVIRNGIDFKRFQNIKESQFEIRKNLGIPVNAYVIGHVGRFSSTKNHDFLVDIFAEVYRKNSNAFLLLIGAGELMEPVKDKIEKLQLSERVLILSHRSDIPQLMKAMDVFVFPSLFEGLGIVLIEAQVAGLRCIVSDTVPKEAFQTKLAVPVSLNESPEKWAEIILDDSVKGGSDGNIDDYDMNKEIKQLEKLYLS